MQRDESTRTRDMFGARAGSIQDSEPERKRRENKKGISDANQPRGQIVAHRPDLGYTIPLLLASLYRGEIRVVQRLTNLQPFTGFSRGSGQAFGSAISAQWARVKRFSRSAAANEFFVPRVGCIESLQNSNTQTRVNL